ncbi:hypothetical protein [Acinetobacter calcoaceticus]|uniref:hypothetical protein n=1 Tax=Acinetobacter calcoaceticus TaxID=471 RepID=UPI002273B9B1|nr:hypothetical protein [Acinetobacter calcoaceticus]GLG83489.1 hypothetical protein ACSO1_20110 [Acinetobacter calcoaceticus]
MISLSRRLMLGLIIFLSFFSINKFPINPVYIFGIIFFLIGLNFVNFRKFGSYSCVGGFFFLAFMTVMCVGVNYQIRTGIPAVYTSSLLFGYSLLLGLLCYEIGKTTSRLDRIVVYKNINLFLIFFMSIELVLRVLNPDPTETGFYRFKESYFYFDSNFTGLVLCAFLAFFYYLKKENIYDIGKISFIILFFLLLLTFSRAAIIAFIFSLVFFKFFGKFFKFFALFVLCAVFYISVILINIFAGGENFADIDGSFNSKFSIINNAIDIYTGLPFFLKLTGIGLANFVNYGGIFAHNIGVTLVFEFGYIGIALFIFYMTYLYKRTKGDLMYLLFPVLICGASLFSAYFAFFFILAALILIEKDTSRLQ